MTDLQNASTLLPTQDTPTLHYGTHDPYTALCGAKLQGVDVPDGAVTCVMCLDLHERGITRADLLLNEVDRKLEPLRG